MVTQQTVPVEAYAHLTTTNKSFLDMHYWLKSRGRKNNAFFLALYDRDLEHINPRDERLNSMWKRKILRECQFNYWYFLREIIRIPDTGGEVGGGVPYKLDRGNLALNFGFTLNWNMFLELPRQFGKTTSALCWYLWIFNFGTTNSEIMFMNKKHDDSKMNLDRLKIMRKALPSYLQMETLLDNDGKQLKAKSNVEKMEHVINGNKITTKPGASSKSKANGLGRGCTMPMQWYDEYAFILHNKIIYLSATPAFSTASKNAKRNHKPYGILITTTPGDLTTDEGMDAYETRNAATVFHEEYYDYTFQQLEELKNLNTSSTFFYIRYTYKQLGANEEYFKKMVKDLKKDWPAIRREVLLEWSNMANNSPFTQQDLEVVSGLLKEPMTTIKLGPEYSSFFMEVYKQVDLINYPPIIGVDIAGGFTKDSSAITVIDSKTTDVIACFNCNYISPIDLAKVIYQLVTQYMPTAIVNIERNGGFGASVISYLCNTKVKRNLYYEIKDRVAEERFNGIKMVKRTEKRKVFGFDETKNSRNLLMEILRERMENHKGKFVSKIIYDELCTLEIKRGGRIEHADNAHDDQIFSMLMALYVWYEGKNLKENYGLDLREIKTDNDTEEIYNMEAEQGLENITKDMEAASYDEGNIIQQQLKYLSESHSMSYDDWLQKQQNENQKALSNLLRTEVGRDAYCKAYNVDPNSLDYNRGLYTMPDEVFTTGGGFEEDHIKTEKELLQDKFMSINNIR